MKNKVAEHEIICKQLNGIYKRKNEDYGDSFSKSFNEYGPTMCAIRLEDKLNRFKKLIASGRAEVYDESIQDTLLDLANYAIMTIMEMPSPKLTADNITTGTIGPDKLSLNDVTIALLNKQQK